MCIRFYTGTHPIPNTDGRDPHRPNPDILARSQITQSDEKQLRW
jgi:hypothetical protein